ncbi:hypothetical protein [Emticicia sp. 17c]|uniref:hypothetical protein n=1 Tax=Emticicia sp. 17c TaxID=3127704 RepID=UPI00301BDB7F
MALIGFEHAIAEKNLLRKALLSFGNRNEIIHCEIILPNRNLRLSSWHDNGVEARQLSDISLNQYLLFDLGQNNDALIIAFFESHKGKKYDKVSLFTDLILGLNLKNNDKFFCSEICYRLLKDELMLSLPDKVASQVSPQELYEMILLLNIPQVYV